MRRYSVPLVLAGLLFVSCGGDDAPEGNGAPTTTIGGGVSVPVGSAECTQAAVAMANAAAAVPLAITGNAGNLETSVAQLEAFAEAAPEEIRADLQAVAAGYASVIQVLQDANYDPSSGVPPSAEVIAQLQAASEQLNDQAYRDAVARVNAWFQTECS